MHSMKNKETYDIMGFVIFEYENIAKNFVIGLMNI